MLRIDGDIVPLKAPKMGPVETKNLCYSILSDKQKQRREPEKKNITRLNKGV